MQRPVMDPLYVEPVEVDSSPREQVKVQLRRAFSLLYRALCILATIDLFSMQRPTPPHVEEPPGHWVPRVIRGVIMKLSLVPVALALAVAGLVYVGTHPPSVPLPGDPATLGLFYDTVSIASSDGKRLEGWLVQPLDARRVILEKERALQAKYPAVVLVHDYAASKQQMLPLMAPLREAGFVVLAISLRGCGGSDDAAQTFGLRERDDVRAAVRLLENQTFVDKTRIAVVGSGTGANAAILAAGDDPAIRAVVLDAPITDPSEAIRRYVVPQHPSLEFLIPLCRWSIEMSWGVSFAQLEMARQVDKVAPRPVLILQGADGSGYPGGAVGRQVIAFLQLHLRPPALKVPSRQKTIVSATR